MAKTKTTTTITIDSDIIRLRHRNFWRISDLIYQINDNELDSISDPYRYIQRFVLINFYM